MKTTTTTTNKLLTAQEAIEIDKKGCFYTEEESGSFGIFGSESGFCYSLHSDEAKAKEETDKMNRNISP